MSSELVAMLGGGITGFVMKFMSAQMEIHSKALERMIAAQGVSDDSADRAAKRTEGGGVWVAPFIFAFYSIPVTIKAEGTGGIFNFLGFHSDRWKSLEGFVLLPEIRQGMLAILGFYFGSSQVTVRR